MSQTFQTNPTGPEDIEIHPLSEDVAAEIRGVDLSQPMSDAAFAEVYQAWLDHHVLLFRGQKLTDPQLIAFSRRFGDLDLAPIPGHGKAFVEGIPEMFVISNVVEDGQLIGSLGDGECLWHTDMSYTEMPPKASCLYSLEVPDAEGDTGFLNMYIAYETLPDTLRNRIEGRTIKHETRYTLDGHDRQGGPPLAEVKASGNFDITSLPGPSHPIARTHSETGRKALYIGRRQNTYVNGLSVAESEELLDALWAHTEGLDRATWHNRWKVGDLLIWDNRCVMHRRDEFTASARRIMHRTQVRDNAPPA
ncbi:MAG: TauD/TfdA dioxygenase family protein [Methyloligellaceae bacterium]